MYGHCYFEIMLNYCVLVGSRFYSLGVGGFHSLVVGEFYSLVKCHLIKFPIQSIKFCGLFILIFRVFIRNLVSTFLRRVHLFLMWE